MTKLDIFMTAILLVAPLVLHISVVLIESGKIRNMVNTISNYIDSRIWRFKIRIGI